MKKLLITIILAAYYFINTESLAFGKANTANAQLPGNLVSLGLIKITSWSGRLVQAHSDNGEMHASQTQGNWHTEETWYLIQVDKPNHIYAFINYSNGKYLGRDGSGCVFANRNTLGATEKWRLTLGQHYGVGNLVCIQSLDGYTLGANKAGDDVKNHCGGEVAAFGKVAPQGNNASWAGWFSFAPCGVPTQGPKIWTQVGDVLHGIQGVVQAAASAVQIYAALAG